MPNCSVKKMLIQRQFLRRIVIVLLACVSVSTFANKTEKAFEALKIYDYFKAKNLFYQGLRKNPVSSSFGLAIIYSRNDNPFSNTDSAAKYIHLGYNSYSLTKIPMSFSGFILDSSTFMKLCDSVALRSFEKIKKTISVIALEKFISNNYLANNKIISEALLIRDEIEFKRTTSANKSDSTLHFIKQHPQSNYYNEALILFDRQIFEELTETNLAEEYISFVKKHPKNTMVNNALELLYNLYRSNSDLKGLKQFIDNYPNSLQYNEAWKQFFALSVKSFSNSELEKFLSENPKFPFKNSILKELELNKLTLYPYEKEELFGFIDSTSKIIIPAIYDEVSDFNESLSIVSKNDSVFFVNKENVNVFGKYYDDAYSFHKGIAVIKQANKWSFINRQGQTIDSYDEINEISNGAYIFKLNNKYGALNHFGKTIIEPRFDKLGDFKNEFAYYIENNKYGFISKTGSVQKAEFDWISDFGENNIAVFKQNNNYGLINSSGKKLLPSEYDLIIKANKNIYILVKNSMYGFYHGSNCWLTAIAFDFLKEKPVEFYTNGDALKLVKKEAQAIMDFNGKVQIDFGTFEEVNFAHNSLNKVKKKNKYGFVDKKLNVVVPIKYQDADDYKDSVTIARLKDKNVLLNLSGKEIFSTNAEIKKISHKYYLIESEQNDLIDKTGERIFTNIKNIQKPNNSLLVITLSNNEIKLLFD